MKYSHQKLTNGISLHMLPMDNYKTTFIGVFFYWPLGEDVAETALIPHLLQRGTASYPTARELRSQLAGLYGSQFGIGVLKRAENLLIQLKVQLVDDHYIPGKNSLLESVLDILREVVFHPYTEHGTFAQRHVAGEKKNVQSRISSLLNDKSRFAFHRCLLHLCPNSGYSKNKYGTLEQVAGVTALSLWQQYQLLLKEAAVDIYVCGRYNHDRVVDAVSRRFSWERSPTVDPREIRIIPPREPQVVKEQMDISQGKLVMALTTDITQNSDLYPALIVYNGILGGFPHSKLFQQVREEKGLAYYIGSSLDSIMGLQFISAGIAADTFAETDSVIRKQLAEMQAGIFDEQTLNWTRAGIRTGLLQMFDDLGEQVSLAVDSRISGRRWTIQGLLDAIDEVDSRKVVEVAERMHLQTSYFLSNGGDSCANNL